MANDILDWLGDLEGVWLVVGVVLLGFGESAILLDLVMPGEAGMVIAGAVIARQAHPLVLFIPFAAAGAFAGDSFSWYLGKRFGRALATRWEPIRRHLEPHLDRAERHFKRRGGLAVFLARWVGALRAVVPFVAGSAAMPFRRFAAWDAPACLVWAATMLGIGHQFGDEIAGAIDRWGWYLSLAVVGALVAWFAGRAVRARVARR